MVVPSDPMLPVLHALRLKGVAEEGELGRTLGLGAGRVSELLGAMTDDGLVVHRVGEVSGFTLTAAGRSEGERRLAAELEASGARDVVAGAYGDFVSLNPRLLRVCTEWQVRDLDGRQQLNDHHDPAYDASVISQLADVDDQVQPVCGRLAAALERFEGYGSRLARAREAVEGGELDWFTKPVIDSYHTVWFELHEDLLATLGIVRGSEPTAEADARG